MIKEFTAAWGENQQKLREYIMGNPVKCYDNYKRLLEEVFNKVINPYLESQGDCTYDVDKIVEIDHGHYQGDYMYVIPKKVYQPSPEDYVISYADYGSCSGCDTLLHILSGIRSDEKGFWIPNNEQVSEFMTLCLNLLQRCKQPYDEEYWKDDVD